MKITAIDLAVVYTEDNYNYIQHTVDLEQHLVDQDAVVDNPGQHCLVVVAAFLDKVADIVKQNTVDNRMVGN